MNNQQVLYIARLHWLLFAGPLIMAIAALYLGIYWLQFKEVALGLLVISLIWGATTWLNYYLSSLTIEKKRIVFRTGILVRKITDIPVNKIESVDIRQSILGSIWRYGSLSVIGTGGTLHYINYVSKPLTCRRYIEQLMQEHLP